MRGTPVEGEGKGKNRVSGVVGYARAPPAVCVDKGVEGDRGFVAGYRGTSLIKKRHPTREQKRDNTSIRNLKGITRPFEIHAFGRGKIYIRLQKTQDGIRLRRGGKHSRAHKHTSK